MSDASQTRPWFFNPDARAWNAPPSTSNPAQFHRSIAGYQVTNLIDLAHVTDDANVGRIVLKEESNRFGLPAFKILGASWAIAHALADYFGIDPAPRTFAALAAAVPPDNTLTLVTATDGNHGRAVAHVAALLGIRARIYVPAGVSEAAIKDIIGEGAELIELPEVYDYVVRAAADSASGRPDDLLIQDTAWPGYESVPQWIVDGYDTLFAEVDRQLTETGDAAGVIVVPTGVGSLLQAAVEHYRGRAASRPRIVSVEPNTAACIAESLAAGVMTSVDTSTPTLMNGLNCGTPSTIAWPVLQAGLDAAIGISEAESAAAVVELTAQDVSSGPCGAATLAALHAILADPDKCAALGLGASTTIVLISTEGTGRTNHS